MTTHKQLLFRSMVWYLIVTALFVVLLLIGNAVITGDGMLFYFLVYSFPAGSAAIGGFAALLSFATVAFWKKSPSIGLVIMLIAHVVGGLIGMSLGRPSSFAGLTFEPALIVPLSGLLAMVLHFGWVFYCAWASAKIWKTNKPNQTVAATSHAEK